jgi:uncharacterized protein YndB with AHSA1/START domain
MKTNKPPIQLTYNLASHPSTVWEALTQLPKMRLWFFDNIPAFEAQVGFKTSFAVQSEDRTFTHQWLITEVVPNKTISYQWQYLEYAGQAKLSFILTPTANGSSLEVLMHVTEDFPDGIPEFKRESCIGGWNYFIGQRLATYLNQNKAQ